MLWLVVLWPAALVVIGVGGPIVFVGGVAAVPAGGAVVAGDGVVGAVA